MSYSNTLNHSASVISDSAKSASSTSGPPLVLSTAVSRKLQSIGTGTIFWLVVDLGNGVPCYESFFSLECIINNTSSSVILTGSRLEIAFSWSSSTTRGAVDNAGIEVPSTESTSSGRKTQRQQKVRSSKYETSKFSSQEGPFSTKLL